MNWCVVIPTYNNEKTLAQVIRDVSKITHNIIVVNDGSTDGTISILQQFKEITVVSYLQNRGKGYALKQGFEEALKQGYSYAVTLDSDGQHFASDIEGFIAKVAAFPNSLIVGERTLPEEKMRKGSSFANRFSNFWFRFISGVHLPDTQSGFRIYPLEYIRDTRFYTNKYEFELEVLIRAAWKGISILSIPIQVYYPEKKDRISHFRPFKDFLRISVLNTVFVFIALFYAKPFSFLNYLKKESISGFLKKHVLHSTDSIMKITFSVMVGVFMGIVPIWGYQLITAIALAYLLRLNKFLVIVAANISIPPMIPFILYLSYLTGGWVLSMDNSLRFTANISLDWVRDNFYQYVVGSLVFAVIMALSFGIITYVLLKLFRKRPVTIG